MPGATWFPGGTLDYVDQALRREDEDVAVIAEAEDRSRVEVSWRDLRDRVRRASAGLRRLGVAEGDRVVAFAPNRLDTLARL